MSSPLFLQVAQGGVGHVNKVASVWNKLDIVLILFAKWHIGVVAE